MATAPHSGLDHLVFAVPDLEAACREIHGTVGLAPRMGGRHPGLGTHNAILAFGDRSYLELIAADPDQPTPESPRPFGIDELAGPRLVTWALACRDIETTVAGARERGYDAGRVLPLSRALPDGGLLRWKLSLRPDGFGGGLVPFLIDWGASPHPSEPVEPACRLSAFRAEHPEPGPVRDALRALGAELAVESGPTPRLLAEIEGPAGRLSLGEPS